jgi:hypothetical protein
MAEKNADSAVDRLLKAVTIAAESVGNVQRANGAPFGWPVILRALDRVDLEFNANGEPELPLLVDDRNKRKILPYPPMLDEDRSAFDELMTRKREEFNARTRRR